MVSQNSAGSPTLKNSSIFRIHNLPEDKMINRDCPDANPVSCRDIYSHECKGKALLSTVYIAGM